MLLGELGAHIRLVHLSPGIPSMMWDGFYELTEHIWNVALCWYQGAGCPPRGTSGGCSEEGQWSQLQQCCPFRRSSVGFGSSVFIVLEEEQTLKKGTRGSLCGEDSNSGQPPDYYPSSLPWSSTPAEWGMGLLVPLVPILVFTICIHVGNWDTERLWTLPKVTQRIHCETWIWTQSGFRIWPFNPGLHSTGIDCPRQGKTQKTKTKLLWPPKVRSRRLTPSRPDF